MTGYESISLLCAIVSTIVTVASYPSNLTLFS